jgi:hypothetical protein
MIVWTGFGFLTVIIGLIAIMLGSLAPNEDVGIAITTLIAAALNFVVGRKLNDPSRDRIVVDAKTGQPLALRSRATLFWLPMEWWSAFFILMSGAAVYRYGVGG